MVSGHALIAGTKQLVHVGRPAGGVAAAVEPSGRRRACAPQPAVPITTLPPRSRLDEMARRHSAPGRGACPSASPRRRSARPSHGVRGRARPRRRPRSLGPQLDARHGRRRGRAAPPEVHVIAVAGPGRHWAPTPTSTVAVTADELEPASRPCSQARAHRSVLVLVDDADTVDDPGGVLEPAVDPPLPPAGRRRSQRRAPGDVLGVDAHAASLEGRCVAAARRRPRRRPLGARLPRRTPVAMVPGRGYVVNSGEAELIQVALPG